MKLEPEDPRLTAYVLGELSEEERREIEVELDRDPDCRQFVEETRALVEELAQDIGSEPEFVLTDDQKRAVEDGISRMDGAGIASPGSARESQSRRWIGWGVGVSLAAGLLLATVFVMREGSDSHPPFEISSVIEEASRDDEKGEKSWGELESVGAKRGTAKSARSQFEDLEVLGEDAGERLGLQDLRQKKEKKGAVRNWTHVVDAEPSPTDLALGVMRENGVQSPELDSKDGISPTPATEESLNALVVRSDVPSRSSGEVRLITDSPVPGTSRVQRSLRDGLSRPSEGGAAGKSQAPSLGKKSVRLAGETPARTLQSLGGKRAKDTKSGPAAPKVDKETIASLRTLGYISDQEGAADFSNRAEGESRADAQLPTTREAPATEAYDHVEENPFSAVRNEPRSTFSIDVDTASYANVRRLLNEGKMPPKGAVRIEEMVNYFDYDYPSAVGGEPFSVHVETSQSLWSSQHRLVRIGIRGKDVRKEDCPPSNLVFLIDVSGSMKSSKKLPLLKQGLNLLVSQLSERDRVAIVVYANGTGVVLPSTSGNNHETIRHALQGLEAGGSTNGGAGIELAYRVAGEKRIEGGINRVILCTDGDLNVGVTNQSDLVSMIKEKAKQGVFLTVLGFGTGNYKDSTLEKIADHGNGNYAYVDSLQEASKVLVQEMMGTLHTIAKDVKIQVEFNPLEVESYRLIGYENRMLATRDFNDDKKDAGEIGAGHTVTALYELIPRGAAVASALPGSDPLKYQFQPEPTSAAHSGQLMTVKLRYKQPDGDKSRLIEVPVTDSWGDLGLSSADFRFAATVAGFGMLLRGSAHKGEMTYAGLKEIASNCLGRDEKGYRREFLELVEKARRISGGR